MTITTDAPTTTRIERLNTASAKRVIDPDVDVQGHLDLSRQVLPDELLSVAGLDLDLTAEQRHTLAREELASIFDNGLRFEAILNAGFSRMIAMAPDLTDPRITYMLHEIGEETRHQRLFARVLTQLDGQAPKPMDKPIFRMLERFGTAQITSRPALLFTLVLAGEEAPDLFQKLASEHPDTDPFIRDVSRYHRSEEARHLSFARAVFGELWATANWRDRFAVRHVAPFVVGQMFDFLVQPGVYTTVGLPDWDTWKAARVSPERAALRHQATRPVLRVLQDNGVFRGDLPKAWQQTCGVDAGGQPLD
ncbi:diiron oxygenase [Actinospongicola halichondriae]|uniref:diiron oxygenase n=1 Tax=Actinospongicola halichondriae TaxID=3236844 RepID=UPI003D3792AF